MNRIIQTIGILALIFAFTSFAHAAPIECFSKDSATKTLIGYGGNYIKWKAGEYATVYSSSEDCTLQLNQSVEFLITSQELIKRGLLFPFLSVKNTKEINDQDIYTLEFKNEVTHSGTAETLSENIDLDWDNITRTLPTSRVAFKFDPTDEDNHEIQFDSGMEVLIPMGIYNLLNDFLKQKEDTEASKISKSGLALSGSSIELNPRVEQGTAKLIPDKINNQTLRYALVGDTEVKITLTIPTGKKVFFSNGAGPEATKKLSESFTETTFTTDYTQGIDILPPKRYPVGPGFTASGTGKENCKSASNGKTCTIIIKSVDGVAMAELSEFQLTYYYEPDSEANYDPTKDKFTLEFEKKNKIKITATQGTTKLTPGSTPNTFILSNTANLQLNFTGGKANQLKYIAATTRDKGIEKSYEEFFSDATTAESGIAITGNKAYSTSTANFDIKSVGNAASIDPTQTFAVRVYYNSNEDDKIDEPEVVDYTFLPQQLEVNFSITQEGGEFTLNTDDSTPKTTIFTPKNVNTLGKFITLSVSGIGEGKKFFVTTIGFNVDADAVAKDMPYNEIDTLFYPVGGNKLNKEVELPKIVNPVDYYLININSGESANKNCAPLGNSKYKCDLKIKSIEGEAILKDKTYTLVYLYDFSGDGKFQSDEMRTIIIRPDAPPCTTLLECLAQLDKTIATKYIENK